jgi:hypothetical protein
VPEVANYPDDAAKTDREIIDECRVRLALAVEAETTNRTEAITDLEFGGGKQWPTDISRSRESDGRPCLTINITDATTRRITNAIRENRPRIKFDPVGGGADVKTAKVRNGMMRHIEAASGADYSYDCASESAVRGGWGYFLIGQKYISEKSFDQELTIEPMRNPFRVYLDPNSQMPDGSDAAWAVIDGWMRRDEYRQKFGHDASSVGRFSRMFGALGLGAGYSDWTRKEEVRVAKYWRIVQKADKLLLYATGKTVFKSQIDDVAAFKMAGLEPVKTRDVVRKQVQWFLLSADEILDRRDWPGKFIPVVPVYGRELDVNGKVTRKGVIRDLRDPARMFNYAETAKTEVYALQPKAPWLMVEGQMEGHEAAWRDANRKPVVALPYKPVRQEDGTMAPPPERQSPPTPAAGFAEWSQSSQSNFMAVAGMPNDPGQDMKGEVVSGVAISRRQGMSDISHFDFYDNLTRSLRHAGNIVNDLIPYFYDTERMQRIIGEDGTPSTVKINEKQRDPETGAIVAVKNDMTGGLYDCVVDTGPGYQTLREEGAEKQMQLLGTPLGEMVATSAGDVVVRSLDFPGADVIADRLAANIPGANIDENSDVPASAQIMIAGLQKQLADANKKGMALELELHSKHALEQMKQEGENKRTQFKESAETHRKTMELETRREDTHVKAQTAHDVAEIHEVGGLLNTHVEAEHNKRAAAELTKSATQAEERPI